MCSRRCLVDRCNIFKKPKKLFYLPKDENAKRIWLQRLGREDLFPTAHMYLYRVCSAHFGPEMWTKSGKRLTSCAIPYWESGEVSGNSDSISNSSPSLEHNADNKDENETQNIGETNTDQLSSTSNASICFFDLNDLHKLNETYESDNKSSLAGTIGNDETCTETTKSRKSLKIKRSKKIILDPIVPLLPLYLPRKKKKTPERNQQLLFAESLLTLKNTINDFVKYEKSCDKSNNNFGAYLDSELRSLDPKSWYVAKFNINRVLFEAFSGRYKNVMIKTNRNNDFNKFHTSAEKVHSPRPVSTVPTRLTSISDAVIPTTSAVLKEPKVSFSTGWQTNKICGTVNKFNTVHSLPIPTVIPNLPGDTVMSTGSVISQQMTMPRVTQVSAVPVQRSLPAGNLVQRISSMPPSS